MTTLLLKSPACEIGCAQCHMACAILPSRIAWWEKEIAEAIPRGDERYTALALQAHEALVKKYAESPRASIARGAMN